MARFGCPDSPPFHHHRPEPPRRRRAASRLRAAVALGLLLGLPPAVAGCGAGGPEAAAAPPVAFAPGEVRATLPAGHPWAEVALATAEGAPLATLPANPGQPGPLVFLHDWTAGARLTLTARAADGSPVTWPLRAPAAAPPPVSVALQLPAGLDLSADGHPVYLPAGARGTLALALRSVGPAPQALTVRLTLPPALRPAGGSAEVVRRVTLRVRGEPALVQVPFTAAEGPEAPLRWRVEGPGLPVPLAGSRTVAVLPPARFAAALSLDAARFPADLAGAPLPHRPAERIALEPGWLRALRGRWGVAAPEDVLRPAGHLGLTVTNRLPGEAVVALRTRTAPLDGDAPAAAFGHPLLVTERGAVLSLARVPPRATVTLAQPVYLDQDAAAPGAYRRCTALHPWGAAEGAATRCETLRVVTGGAWGWAGLWLLTALCAGAALFALARLPRWLPGFPLRDAVFVALTVGLALVAVTLPGALLRAVSLFVAGPFAFLVDDLVFKLLLFVLLGALFALVRRPGVYFLFYALWMVFQALLQGQFTPVLALFGAVAVSVLEAGLWLGGLTRPGAPVPRRWRLGAAALVVGACEGLIVTWHLHLIQALYRQFFADWYLAAQGMSAAVYAGLGTAAGLALGARLAPLRGFATAAADVPPTSPSAPAPADPAPLVLAGLTLVPEGAAAPILHSVSLRAAAGELVLLGGRSGAGKTSLLRVIQGLAPLPPGASLTLGGTDARRLSPPERARRTGLLFQEPAFQVVRPTVRGEAAFGLDVLGDRLGLARAACAARVNRALRFLGLAALAERRTGAISGGELQRTALASLLAVRPPLLLLDEPLAHLDAPGRARLVRRLATLARAGAAVVVAEHRLEALLPRAHRVVWLEAGRVAWEGSAAAFRTAPPLVARLAISPPQRPTRAFRSRPTAAPPAALADVTFAYRDGAPVLRGVRAELAPGRAVALMGPNGAGKSTLLALLVGLLRPGTGTVLLEGRLAARLSWTRRAAAVGYLPQQAELLLQAPTVADELTSALRWRGASTNEIDRALAAWLPRLGLAHAADRFPHLLSRGERRRLAVGAVAIAGPRLLLLDEPFAGQDAAQTTALLEICAAFLAGDPRRALLVSSHDLAPLAGFFDEAWHLADGALSIRAAAPAPPGDVLHVRVGA